MKIGFIGLGIMGKPMCRNLMKNGHEMVVYNRSSASMEELAKEGAVMAKSPAELAAQCETIITMVPNSPNVRDVALSENGIIKGAKPGTVLIDMSSIDGTLSIMVGGKKELYDRYYDVLMCMGASAVYVGEIGAGNIAKLANQMIVAINIAAVGEALTMAAKTGADPELVYQAIRGGLAGSTVLDAKAPMMMDRNFKPGFRIELHIKDLNNAIAAAHSSETAVPLTSQVMEMMQSLKADGCAKEDHSALVKFYEKISDTIVKH